MNECLRVCVLGVLAKESFRHTYVYESGGDGGGGAGGGARRRGGTAPVVTPSDGWRHVESPAAIGWQVEQTGRTPESRLTLECRELPAHSR